MTIRSTRITTVPGIMAVLAVVVLAVALAGCGPKTRKPSGVMDSPLHHFNMGQSFLDQDKPVDAGREFDLALGLDARYAPAMAGKALVLAIQGNDDEALKLSDKAVRQARNEKGDERMWPLVHRIRAFTEMARGGRLSEARLVMAVREPLDQGKVADSSFSPLYYYAGDAYLQALDFDRAEEMYRKVLDLQTDMLDQASARLELVDKVKRAAPGTVVGKRIALVDSISRADLAALLVEELGVAKFYGRTNEMASNTFQEPVTDKPARYEERGVSDIQGHPLQADVEQVLEYGVKGLEAYPDNTFRPDEAMTRAEAAMIYEDVIVRATGKDELATMYIGQPSRIPDVRGDHPAFNAVMLVTARGVMEGAVRSGGFDPLGPVPGVDALLSIQKLKSELSVF